MTTVKRLPNAKFNKTIIQGRTEDKKYLVITHNQLIDAELMSGDIVYFMDIVVGKYKNQDNIHFNYDWELTKDSKVRLLERNSEKVHRDIFLGNSPTNASNESTKPKIQTPVNISKESSRPKNPNPIPNSNKGVSTPGPKKWNQTPGPKNETPKTNNNPLEKSKKQVKIKENKPDDLQSVISTVANKQKNIVIQGYLHEEFRKQTYNEKQNNIDFFVGKVQKIEGDLITVFVQQNVKLPLILKKGYLLQISGKDILLGMETVRMIEQDSQLIFKGFGRVEEQVGGVRRNPEMPTTSVNQGNSSLQSTISSFRERAPAGRQPPGQNWSS